MLSGLEMRPSLAFANEADCGDTNTVAFGKNFAFHTECAQVSNFLYRLIGQLCFMVRCAASNHLRITARPVLVSRSGIGCMSSFGHHVRSVIGGSASKQVFGLDANSDVARVANVQAAWNQANPCSVGDTVRQMQFPVQSEATATAAARTNPEPTTAFGFRTLVNVREKTRKCFFGEYHKAVNLLIRLDGFRSLARCGTILLPLDYTAENAVSGFEKTRKSPNLPNLQGSYT